MARSDETQHDMGQSNRDAGVAVSVRALLARGRVESGLLCSGSNNRRSYICPNCECPNYFHGEKQTPKPVPGSPIGHLPADIEALLNESRRAVAVGSDTAAVLLARKMLMHIAVAQGANHELVVMTATDSAEVLSFLEMLLIFVYDFPNRVPKPSAT